MLLHAIDWSFVIIFFALSLAIGITVARRAGSSTSECFLSGRKMPWWLLGISMVATTFSTDTPNLVTDIVRTNGVFGNWVWWAFLLTGMLTVFVYAKLWSRSKVMTDVEFYELRYSGRAAAFLRGFRALYLGVFFNVVIMASVSLAAIKIGGVIAGLSPVQTMLIAATVTTLYSVLGGLRGVLITDLFQFVLAMAGSIAVAFYALGAPQVGGLANLLSHPRIQAPLPLVPNFSDTNTLVGLFVIPFAVQWWSVWYPGSEPGGGGFIAQRMLAARDGGQARAATLLFNVAHYALRPWPWIIVALCSLLVFPTTQSLMTAFPHMDPGIVRHDMAYPAMLTFLPHGLLGLVVASLIAAYMSTISTHLNWGSSYIVNDFYKRFIDPGATEAKLVLVGRISTVGLMILAGLLSLCMSHALEVFQIMLQIGAGTGLLFILRWFWWRINAASEITAMTVSFVVALYFQFIHAGTNLPALEDWQKLTIGVAITTIAWVLVTLLTAPTDRKTLLNFYRIARPGGPGWLTVLKQADAGDAAGLDTRWDVPTGILCMFLSCVAVYSALLGTGCWIYSNYTPAILLTITTAASTALLVRAWRKLGS